jgi:phosphoglycerate dehydrogenase-like enzyme
MIKAAFIATSGQIHPVYSGGRKEKIALEFDLFPDVITSKALEERHSELKDIQYLFSTWGMINLNKEQIALLPSLKAVFYSAGSVQGFARPFLEAGIKVFSAWAANAIPVAEYTVAQILLANKGFFRATHCMKSKQDRNKLDSKSLHGNYETTIALLGAGMIGRAVIERLKSYDLNIIVFDPFLSDTDAVDLGVEKVSLENAFKRGLVVSNHLANLPETKAMLKGHHFETMPEYSTFINTGRGATVDEKAMINVLQSRPDLTALLDVTCPEPSEKGSPLYTLKNVILTPHIAGSKGDQEVLRMADFMIEEAISLREGNALKYEVTEKMLKTMA